MKTNNIKAWQSAAIMMLITLLLPWQRALAADYDQFTVNGINYQVTSEANKTVQTLRGGYTGDIVIPPTVENNGTVYTVTAIGWYTFSQTSVTSVSLPPTISRFGDCAFAHTSLKEIVLPSSMRIIGRFAFSGSSIESINFPEGLESIEEEAFHSCKGLTHVELPQSLTTLGGGAFLGTSLRSVTIPGSVDVVGKSAFSPCDSLREVIIEEGVRAIDDYAFFRDQNIQVMRLPSSITYLGGNAIYCKGDMYLPKAFPPNGRGDMSWCDAINRLHIPVGTMQHFTSTPRWNIWGITEDADLGTYCDINFTHNGLGDVLVDSTEVSFYKDFVFAQAGSDIKLTFEPHPKHLIDTVTLNGEDITNKIVGATIYCDTHEMDLSDEIIHTGTYLIKNLQQPISVEAQFIGQRYTKLAVRQGAGGTITVRLHRNDPLHVQVNHLSDNELSSATLDGADCMGSLNGNTLYLGPIDDPALLEVKFSKVGEQQ